MGRLLAIDYGRKRCGIAATDSLRIVATGVATVPSASLIDWLKIYMSKEEVDAIVVGQPTTMRGEPSESMRYIEPALKHLRRTFPDKEIIMWDERFTSTLAHKAMIDGGMRKSRRTDKAVVDEMAATIILNDYLQSKAYK